MGKKSLRASKGKKILSENNRGSRQLKQCMSSYFIRKMGYNQYFLPKEIIFARFKLMSF